MFAGNAHRNAAGTMQKPFNHFERHPCITIATLVCVCVVIADLVAGYLFISRHDEYRIRDPYFHHGFAPSVSTIATWGADSYPFRTNNLGLRDGSAREVPPKPAGTRWLIMGDSFAEGVGIAWEDTFAGRLERKVKGKAEIINAGVSSYSPRLHVLKLKYLLEQRQLDIHQVIVFTDVMDVMDDQLYELFVPYDNDTVKLAMTRMHSFLNRHSMLWFGMNNLFFRPRFDKSIQDMAFQEMGGGFTAKEAREMSRLFARYPDLAMNRFNNFWTVEPDAISTSGRRGLAVMSRNMSSLAALCRQRGIALSIVVFPRPAQLISGDRHSLYAGHWKEFCRTNNIRFINLFETFFSLGPAKDVIDRYFIPGDVHWNPAGHRVVADALTADLAVRTE